MKRWLLFVLVLLLTLSGCLWEPVEQTQPTQTTAPMETSIPETKPSIYNPDDPIEEETAGAVCGYTLEDDRCDIAFMGESLLLFYNDGYGPTRLVLLDPETHSEKFTTELMGTVYPENVSVTQSNIGYYSEMENAVIVLDKQLREVSRTVLPGNAQGIPVVREDMTEAYYAAGSDIRAIDLESGISRLVRQRDCLELTVQKSIFADTILVCSVSETEGKSFTEFISTETGETLGSDSDLIKIDAWEDRYFLQRMEGIVLEQLFAQGDGALQTIQPRDTEALCNVMSMNALVGLAENTGAGVSLSVYNLETGSRTAEIQLESLRAVYDITADPDGKHLWFLGENRQRTAGLYRWDMSASSLKEDTRYTGVRYTRESPDEEGLAKCHDLAGAIEAKYGIELLLEKEPYSTLDYGFVYEYHPQAFIAALELLEQTLAKFPEDFFEDLGQVSKSGKIHIGLVRSLRSRTSNAVAGAPGDQYWADGKACIVLAVGDTIPQSLFHGVAHVVDTHILNESLAFDDWEKLNPEGFAYNENYTDYLTWEDSQWLEGETQAFTDAFAMCYAREDRAQIFEYAMQAGNQEVFASDTMQKKLLTVCKGIRDAFGWRKTEGVFPWEQYLEKPLD